MAPHTGPAQPYSTPEEYFFEADRLINAGEVNPAFTLLRELTSKFPDYGRAYNHLGFLYETKYRDPAKAEDCYRRCLELSPDYPALYLNYAILLNNQNRWEELEALLQKALQVAGINKAKVYNEYAIMHEVLGNFDSSIAEYRRAIQFSFSDSDIASYEKSIARVEQKKGLLN